MVWHSTNLRVTVRKLRHPAPPQPPSTYWPTISASPPLDEHCESLGSSSGIVGRGMAADKPRCVARRQACRYNKHNIHYLNINAVSVLTWREELFAWRRPNFRLGWVGHPGTSRQTHGSGRCALPRGSGGCYYHYSCCCRTCNPCAHPQCVPLQWMGSFRVRHILHSRLWLERVGFSHHPHQWLGCGKRHCSWQWHQLDAAHQLHWASSRVSSRLPGLPCPAHGAWL